MFCDPEFEYRFQNFNRTCQYCGGFKQTLPVGEHFAEMCLACTVESKDRLAGAIVSSWYQLCTPDEIQAINAVGWYWYVKHTVEHTWKAMLARGFIPEEDAC